MSHHGRGGCARWRLLPVQEFVEVQDAVDEVGWMRGVGPGSGRHLTGFEVSFGELLGAAPTDVVPIRDVVVLSSWSTTSRLIRVMSSASSFT